MTNTGELTIKVAISYSTSEIAPGKSDTFTLTWPGRDTMHVNMLYYPVAQPARSQNRDLELNHGDVLDLELGFSKN